MSISLESDLEKAWWISVASITAVIKDAEDILNNKVALNLQEDKIFQAELETTNRKLQTLRKDILEATQLRAYLDCEALEELMDENIEENTQFEHKAKCSRLTPEFKFNLKTKYPIREFVYTLGPGAKWKNGHPKCEIGLIWFKGEVETNGFRSMSANVQLFGWRREVYAKEISSFAEKVSSLQKHRDEVREEVVWMEQRRTQLEQQRLVWLAEIDRGESDLKKLAAADIHDKGWRNELKPY